MRAFFEKTIPNLNIALTLSLLTVTVLHIFNPMMGFFHGKPIIVLVGAECVVSLINAFSSYFSARRRRKIRAIRARSPEPRQ